ncbi:hypothetical protein [Agrobacterium pusense]|uniref:hypothetical protein n=1 Tax=Agrobacterium pusense TaxID=648995 RepID=UPI00289DD4E1|nr:hypothetical protein [Agrobacterium pusense]
MSYAVKVRKKGSKAFKFISSGGSMNSLRIHAVQFPTEEKASAFVSANSTSNPEYEFKVVPLED